MGLLLVLGRLSAAIASFIRALMGLREAAAHADGRVPSSLAVALFVASFPPTVLCLVCLFVLLQAAPTAQFNAGKEWRMDLWSFWVDWWSLFLTFSWLQLAVYFFWLIAVYADQASNAIRHTVTLSLLASVLGTILLSFAFPTA